MAQSLCAHSNQNEFPLGSWTRYLSRAHGHFHQGWLALCKFSGLCTRAPQALGQLPVWAGASVLGGSHPAPVGESCHLAVWQAGVARGRVSPWHGSAGSPGESFYVAKGHQELTANAEQTRAQGSRSRSRTCGCALQGGIFLVGQHSPEGGAGQASALSSALEHCSGQTRGLKCGVSVLPQDQTQHFLPPPFLSQVGLLLGKEKQEGQCRRLFQGQTWEWGTVRGGTGHLAPLRARGEERCPTVPSWEEGALCHVAPQALGYLPAWAGASLWEGATLHLWGSPVPWQPGRQVWPGRKAHPATRCRHWLATVGEFIEASE